MCIDPDTIWEGGFPYDVLAFADVDPDTPIQRVMMSMATIQRAGKRAEAHLAWSQLSAVNKRLFVDFFLYRHEPTEDSED